MASDSTNKLTVLEEKIKGLDNKNADGNLMIKVSKRDTAVPHGMYRPQIVCTLTGGAVSHVANPELWLPRLMGGGSFSLGVFVPEASSVALVDGIEITLNGIEERRFPDLDAPDDPLWKGPKSIIYPLKTSVKQATPTVIASPPNPSNTTLAPQTPLSGMGGNSGATHHDQELRRLIEEQRAYSLNLQQQLEAERRQREEDRHKREMEILRAQQQAELERQRREMEQVREELKTIKNTPPPAPAHQPSLLEMLKEALPVVAPLITTWMGASAERERRSEERQNKILESIASRPAIDPMIKEILDQKAANELPLATYMQQSAAATAALIGQMATMAKDMVEMSAGPEESTAIKAIREVGNVVQGIASAASTPAIRPPRRLPRVEGDPNPLPTPAAPQQPAMHGLDEASPPAQPVLLKLRTMLLAKEDPEKVAAETVKAFNTPEFQKALDASGGDPVILFQSLLGAPWIEANLEYVNSFGQAFTKKAQAAGIEAISEDDEAEEEAA